MTIVKPKPIFINNMFDDLWNNIPTQPAFHQSLIPVNIHQTKDGFYVELNVAGIKKEEITINAEKGILTISHEKKTEIENEEIKTLRREFSSKSFKRSFSIEDDVNIDGVKATCENGVLVVYLPKKEEIKMNAKQIAIL